KDVMKRSIVTIGLAALAGVAAFATVSGGSSAGGSGPSVEHASTIAWKACRGAPKVQCGAIQVPIDWAKPNGPKLTVRFARRPADSPDNRVGTLFFQPGGPGDGGISYMKPGDAELHFSAALRARFDLIGVDPRGFGESTPVSCGVPLTVEGVTLFPHTPLEFQRLLRHNRAFGAS